MTLTWQIYCTSPQGVRCMSVCCVEVGRGGFGHLCSSGTNMGKEQTEGEKELKNRSLKLLVRAEVEIWPLPQAFGHIHNADEELKCRKTTTERKILTWVFEHV